MHDLLLV